MRSDVLPHGCLPRGLTREQAAAYVGVGVTKFDETVADGRMPKPRRINGRKLWDRLELDVHFAELPHDGETEVELPEPEA